MGQGEAIRCKNRAWVSKYLQWAVSKSFQAQCSTIPTTDYINISLISAVISMCSPSILTVISLKSIKVSQSFPLAVTKSWSNGDCLKQAAHLALGCACPFSASMGPCPQFVHPHLRWWTMADPSALQYSIGWVWFVCVLVFLALLSISVHYYVIVW